jgi:hypothetical protein
VVACDCIYNESLVDPFVQTCADACRLRSSDGSPEIFYQERPSQPRQQPCICVIAQQLRNPDVFQRWLEGFMRDFRVWRLPDAHLLPGLRPDRGFVVHVGFLRRDLDSMEGEQGPGY